MFVNILERLRFTVGAAIFSGSRAGLRTPSLILQQEAYSGHPYGAKGRAGGADGYQGAFRYIDREGLINNGGGTAVVAAADRRR